MTTTSPRCTGCETFVRRLFDPSPLPDTKITLHRNFAELSKCATELCDLCKFMRRQFYYHSADYVSYNHTDQRLQDDSNSVYVYVSTLDRDSSEELCDVTKRSWQFYHGNLPGPSSSSHNKYVEDRTPVPHILGNDISLEKLLTLSRQWLTTCIVDHKKCGSRTSGGSSYLPTRLLDVGSPGQPSIQLVLSEDLPKSQKNDYITLSYCWGLAKYAACTTKANLIERLRAIPTSSLPKTLADAVEIVRALRVKYLWIDALCIIQAAEGEESEDWREEFPSMGKTYQHSLCTIAASGAEHSGMGCFYRREAAGWPVQNYFLTDERRELGNDNPVIIEATLPNWNISVENSALAKRGWVLQERMLAPRTLFWTEDGLFWNCSERNASECQAHLQYSNRKFPLLHELVEHMQSAGRDHIREQKAWVNVLEEYSQKRLTVLSDKLAALAGLGNEVARVTGLKYEMGIWRSNMIRELAWGADFSILSKDDSVQPQAARLPGQPSWSWASMNQKLCFRPGRYGWRSEELVEVEMLPLSLSDASNTHSAERKLRVRGRIGQLQVSKTRSKISLSYEQVYHPTRCTFEPLREASNPGSFNEMREVAIIDTITDTLPETGGSVTCLRWMRWEDHLRYSASTQDGGRYLTATGAMIITPVNENEKVYRRIGWADVVNDDCFGQDDQTIVLV